MTDAVPIFSGLFKGIDFDDGVNLMNRLGATTRRIKAGEAVFRTGCLKRNIGVLIDGELEMFELDADGRRSMIGVVKPPEAFAQVFAFAKVERHPATVLAREDSKILVIPIAKILPEPGAMIEPIQRRFIENLMCEICNTAWALRSRAFILSRRSTEERLMTYLRQQMRAVGSPSFTIPYNRQALADFLCVDRSALSALMSKLAKRGLFTYHKNAFVLKGRAGEMSPAMD